MSHPCNHMTLFCCRGQSVWHRERVFFFFYPIESKSTDYLLRNHNAMCLHAPLASVLTWYVEDWLDQESQCLLPAHKYHKYKYGGLCFLPKHLKDSLVIWRGVDMKRSMAIHILTVLEKVHIWASAGNPTSLGLQSLKGTGVGPSNIDLRVLYLFLNSNTLNRHMYIYSQYITTQHLNTHIHITFMHKHTALQCAAQHCTTLSPLVCRCCPLAQ